MTYSHMPEIWRILKDIMSLQILGVNTFEIWNKGSEYKKNLPG